MAEDTQEMKAGGLQEEEEGGEGVVFLDYSSRTLLLTCSMSKIYCTPNIALNYFFIGPR